MKQLIHIPQGDSHLIGGQWYNQGDHEIDVPDPVEVAPAEAIAHEPEPTSGRRGKKSDAPILDASAQPENVEASAPESSPETPSQPENKE